jgi:hypothetical protein
MGEQEGMGTGMVIGRALAVSVIISLLMMLTTLGFMYLFSGMSLPLSTAIVLVVFAISFVIAAVLIDRASEDLFASFVGGASVALSITVFVIALVSGAYFIIDKMKLPGLDILLTGFALCLIASLIINRLTLKI